MLELFINYLKANDGNRRFIYISLALYCFVLMLFCTKSSPFFSFNDWFDANVYFTMGKGWMNGLVPYIDLIDNNGPFLYLIYGFAWIVGRNGFFGVYLFQTLFLVLSVIYVYRLANMFLKVNALAFIIAVLSPLPMLLHQFYAHGYGGGGPDEFSRALLIVSLYYFTLYYMKPEAYKFRHTIIQGVLFACVVFMKSAIAWFWFGFVFVIACTHLYHKRYRVLLKDMAAFMSGLFALSLPYLIYAAVTKSLGAFYELYFVSGGMYADVNEKAPWIKSLVLCIQDLSQRWVFGLVLFIGIAYIFLTCKNSFKTGYLLSLLALLMATFNSLVNAFTYLPISVFHIFGLIAIGAMVKQYVNDERIFSPGEKMFAASVVMIITIGMNSLTAYPYFFGKEETVQHKMAETLLHHARNNKPTLLEIGGMDSGFYTVSGILPGEPYFYIHNEINHNDFPQPRDAQRRVVQGRGAEFIISQFNKNDKEHNPYEVLVNYDPITIIQGTGNQSKYYYHLFQLKEHPYDLTIKRKIKNIESNINDGIEKFVAMLDADFDTRWHTGRAQQLGDYLSIEFHEPVNYNCLQMYVGKNKDDYPRQLSIETSMDGVNWINAPKINEKVEQYYVEFEATPYRHIKLLVNGTEKNHWSVCELEFGYLEPIDGDK